MGLGKFFRTVSAAIAVLMAAGCSEKQPQTPAEGLKPPYDPVDRIWYCGQILDIKSALYEETGDGYAFYLSPTSGITGIEGMEQKGDFLKLRTASSDLSDAAGDFSLSYRQIAVTEATSKGLKAFNLDFTFKDGRLEFYVWVLDNDGLEMVASFNGEISAAGGETGGGEEALSCQYEIDGEAGDVGSILDWRTPLGGRTYYIYKEAGVLSPAEAPVPVIEISIPDNLFGKKTDLQTSGDVVLKCLGESLSGNLTGSLTAAEGRLGIPLSLELSASDGTRTVRLGYSGSPVAGYAAENFLEVTRSEGQTARKVLDKVFCRNAMTSLSFAFGDAEGEISEPSDLKGNGENGANYAVALTLAANQTGRKIEFSGESSEVGVNVYDYRKGTVSTIKNGGVAGGNVLVLPGLNANGDSYYVSVSVTLSDGVVIGAEYYGKVAYTVEEMDLVPVPDDPSFIRVLDSDEVELFRVAVTQLQVRKTETYQSSLSGEIVSPAYVFYFINEMTDPETDPHNDQACTPQLILSEASLNLNRQDVSKNYFWNLLYSYKGGQPLLYRNGYCSIYNGFGYCPEGTLLTSMWNQDNSLDLVFTMTDATVTWGSVTGTKNVITLEWHGKASLYRGSQQNLLTESDLN